MFSNQKKEVSCENGIFHNHCSDNFEPISKDNCALALHCPLLRASTGFFFSVFKGKLPAIKSLNWNEGSCESGILHKPCSDNVEPISKDNSAFALHCPLLRGSTDFFFVRLQGKHSSIKSLNWNEVSCESGILHNHCSDNVEPISKDNSALALHCPLLRGPTDFFFCVSKGNTPTIKSLIWNEVSCESGNLHNHFSDNVEPISKGNSAFTLHCPLLRGPTDFFLLRLQGKTPTTKSLIWNKVSCESGILHKHCSDNVEPISKNNCAFALQCPLLRGPTEFFFCVSKGKTPVIKSLNWNEVSCENGILHNHCSHNVEPISKDNSEFALHCLQLDGSTFFFSMPPRRKPQS